MVALKSMKLPLAIYTADHGLKWTFDETKISYRDLDLCRTMFGRLPDFDLGEPGFEGVAAVGDRIYVVRCFSVPKWDFLGRDATYLVATWFDCQRVCMVDLEDLLSARELNEPMRDPLVSFDFRSVDTNAESGFSKLVRESFCVLQQTTFRYRRSIGSTSIVSVNAPIREKSPPQPQSTEEARNSKRYVAIAPCAETVNSTMSEGVRLFAAFLLGVAVGLLIAGSFYILAKGNDRQKEMNENVESGTIFERRRTTAPSHGGDSKNDCRRRIS